MPSWVLMVSAAGLSVAMVTAFSAGDTGARTVTASVVTDSNAYLALEANSGSPHDGFVTTTSEGVLVMTFDGNNGDATGSGLNPNATYMFDSIIKITNKGTTAVDVDITIGGTDAAYCTVALTSTTTQTTGDYGTDPTAVSLSAASSGYLGIGFALDGSSMTSGDTADCTVTVTATRP